ncbi:SHOCT domain-containing protein [Halococcus saccharolyticus]|uniref:Uncharacterized protein n=1 Tax=Halococcus saccharolyticus DSM 5350 TaxID=1227455 RepID=M0MGB3_9EURY|nr:SHOCT domain-containing protein [Halococcus saccharolyticus]EMA44746.1 hypothetical protein C449_08814 [Halococcus saccharolyticus DSM 5350]
MGWLRDNALAVWLGVLLVSGILLTVVLGYVGLVVTTALGGGAGAVGVLSGLALPYLPIVAVLVVATVISGLGFSWSLLRRLSIPRSERLQSAAERVEREYPAIDGLGLSETVAPPEPSTEDALDDLKRRYVAGEIDEPTFERKLDRLVANESVDDVRAAREREAVLDERSSERSS